MTRHPINGRVRSTLNRRQVLLAASAALGVSCRDKEKELLETAGPALDELAPLTERDTKQVRDGLPQTASVIVQHLDSDPASDVEGIKRALRKSREEVKDLAFSKITFFAFVGRDGMVLRSEADTDLAAGASIIEAIPDTKKLVGDGAQAVETFGYMKGLRGVNEGSELQWIVGAPVTSKEGKNVGALVGGWSLRLYAKYLGETVTAHLEKKQGGEKSLPLAYTFVVKGKTAYGGPEAPDVNAAALGELDLPAHVKDGLYQTTTEIEGRRFIVAAKKAPPLGDDLYLALMLSPI